MLQKNWAQAMMLKALPLAHFWSVLLLKEEMMISVKKTLQMLKCKTNPFPAKFVLKIPTKSVFLYQLFSGKVCLENSCNCSAKSADFSVNFYLKIPQNFPFFHDLS